MRRMPKKLLKNKKIERNTSHWATLLLNPKAFNVKRRWDDDVVFKNQARGTEQKGNKEFVNVSVANVPSQPQD